jgi:hypothetical protein
VDAVGLGKTENAINIGVTRKYWTSRDGAGFESGGHSLRQHLFCSVWSRHAASMPHAGPEVAAQRSAVQRWPLAGGFTTQHPAKVALAGR